MQTLRVLIKAGNRQAVQLAVTAIDEFLAAHPGPQSKTNALSTLEDELIGLNLDENAQRPPGSEDFSDLVYAYIDKRRTDLRGYP